MSSIRFSNVMKRYDNGVVAVDKLNLTIEDGEFVVLLGPSGCGKSTTLFMLAGLEQITEGEVYINDVYMNDFPPQYRDISIVFQNYALFPNLNVYDNIGFGLTIRKVNKEEKDKKIRYAADLLGLTEYLDRKPKQLSGGQKQRVAIGRCIVRDASVFLFDEPLSNLDVKLRAQMRKEIQSLYNLLNATMVYVTHDQSEAMALATKIVIMKDGIVQQVGTPVEVYDRPQNLFVATFIGAPQMNIIKVQVAFSADKTFVLLPNRQRLQMTGEQAQTLREKAEHGQTLYMGLRPQFVTPITQPCEDAISGPVSLIEVLGLERNLYFTALEQPLIATTESEMAINQEEQHFILDVAHAVFFHHETEMIL